MQYPNGLKERLVQRMAGRERISGCALSKESGVPQPTLSRWLREASTVAAMTKPSESQETKKASWSPQEKLRVVLAAQTLTGADLGELLRREGLHAAQLEEWRRATLTALAGSAASQPKRSAEDGKRIKELERDILRKDRALAEVTALLVLQKKAQAIWGGADGDTATKKGT